MTAELEVRYEQRAVGRLRCDEAGRLCFRYDPVWLDDAAAFAISVSLSKRAGEIAGRAAQGFFANLLPEGLVRHRVARRLGISEHNDFELLRAIGGECAGALSIRRRLRRTRTRLSRGG